MFKNLIFCAVCSLAATFSVAQITNEPATDPHRPQFHFTPQAHWMNDPNGMVYHNGVYHLFFQYYPDSTVWGPMHWGHATSKNMIDWKEQPIALYPDSLGYIFSGSAVVDENNTTGFGKNGKAPLVAIFTHHNMDGEKANSNTFQNQSIAYSNDEGKTWTKYAGNPVLKNPGVRDFRDPKVSWYAPGKKWVMTLATQDRITFYSSKNLKDWVKESEFGKTLGAHGGVWECPDLFALDADGKKVWVLLVSINPGGPNGGSATQYFTGSFDGTTFTPNDTTTKWMDFGTDNYAGVTFSNTANRRILMGWMSNWQYAQIVPTKAWRSATTIPRELGIKKIAGKTYLTSTPVKEFYVKTKQTKTLPIITVKDSYDLGSKINLSSPLFSLKLSAQEKDFSIVLANELGDEITIGFDKLANEYYIDRTKSGIVNFEPGFAKKHVAPRIGKGAISLTLIADVASVELFADNGLTVMTDIFFPNQPMTKLFVKSVSGIQLSKVNYSQL